jgi:hypothetical protein
MFGIVGSVLNPKSPRFVRGLFCVVVIVISYVSPVVYSVFFGVVLYDSAIF